MVAMNYLIRCFLIDKALLFLSKPSLFLLIHVQNNHPAQYIVSENCFAINCEKSGIFFATVYGGWQPCVYMCYCLSGKSLIRVGH